MDLSESSLLSNESKTNGYSTDESPSTISDVNIKIHNERIVSILNELIYKTEISIFLLNIEEVDSLEHVIAQNQLNIIRKFITSSLNVNHIQNNEHEINKDDILKIIRNPMVKSFPALSEVIQIIYNNQDMKQIINDSIQKIQEEGKGNSGIHLYYHTLIKFKNKMIDRLNFSAEDKLRRDLVNKNLTRSNKILKAQIDFIESDIQTDREAFERILKEKENLIKQHQEELNYLNIKSRNVILQDIVEAENTIKEITSSHKEKVEILSNKIDDRLLYYKMLLDKNMEIENKHRSERILAEKKLTDLLKEYDIVVGGKQDDLDNLTNDYEAEKREFMQLQKLFDEQESEYIPLMAEKEAEYQREILQKMATFLMEHAARVIQRAWRQILASRAEKKKGKRGAGKKKKKDA